MRSMQAASDQHRRRNQQENPGDAQETVVIEELKRDKARHFGQVHHGEEECGRADEAARRHLGLQQQIRGEGRRANVGQRGAEA